MESVDYMKVVVDIVNSICLECNDIQSTKHNIIIETISNKKLFVTEFNVINKKVFVDRVTYGDEEGEELELSSEILKLIENEF